MTTFDPGQLLRQDLLGLPPYLMTPTTIDDLNRVIKLDTNENPFGPSPKTAAAFANMQHWNRYITQDELRPAVARYVGASEENIVVGNGADEMIDLVQRIYLGPGDAIIDCPPSFEMYSLQAKVNGARVVEIPRRNDFTIDVSAMERAVEKHKPKLIFLANPSNPDGTCASRADIERLLALPIVLILDEAYAEFAGESFAGEVPKRKNLIVLRTFSKWAGLAGLRVGYCVAPPAISDQIMRVKSPYNVNAAAIVAAQVALQDVEYMRGNIRRIISERERLSAALRQTGLLEPLPTSANFILCRVVGREARQVKEALARRGILIRSYSSARLSSYVRISVGTEEQNDMLLQALGEIGRENR